MSKSIKRVLAMLLSVCMVVGMMPTLAFAGTTGNIKSVVVGDAKITSAATGGGTEESNAPTWKVEANYKELKSSTVEIELDEATDEVWWVDYDHKNEITTTQQKATKDENGVATIEGVDLSDKDKPLIFKVGATGTQANGSGYFKLQGDPTYTITLGGTGVEWYDENGENLVPNQRIELKADDSSGKKVSVKAKKGFKELEGNVGISTSNANVKAEAPDPAASGKVTVTIKTEAGLNEDATVSCVATAESSEAKIKKVDVKTSDGETTSKTVTSDGSTFDNPTLITVDVPYVDNTSGKNVTLTLSDASAKAVYIEKDASEAAPKVNDYENGDIAKNATSAFSADLSKVYYVRVTAADTKTVKFYKIAFNVEAAKADAELATLEVKYTVGTSTQKTKDILNNVKKHSTFDEAKADSTEIEIPYHKEGKADIEVTTKSGGAILTWAKSGVVASGGIKKQVPVEKLENLKSAKGEVWLKLTAQNGVEAFYHFFVVMAQPSNDATVKKVKVAGYEGEITAATTTKDGSTIAKAIEVVVKVPKGTKSGLDSEGIAVTADEGATVKGEVTSSGIPSSITNLTFTDADADGVHEINASGLNTGDLYLEVTAQNGTSKLYYRVIVEDQKFEVVEDMPTTSPKDGVQITDADAKGKVEAAVEGTVFDVTDSSDILHELTNAVISDNLNYPADSDVKDMIAEQRGSAVSGTVKFIAIPYLDIEVAANGYDEEQGVYVLDITPKYYVVATTAASATTVKLTSDTKSEINAVKISAATDKKLELKDVKIKITLPDNFMSNGEDEAYIRHETDNAVKVDVDGSGTTGRSIDYTAKSFSTFTITKEVPGEATITIDSETTVYETLQDAVDAVGNGNVIVLTEKADGKDYSKLQTPVGRSYFTILPGDSNIEISSIGFVPTTSGSYTYTAEIDKDGKVTITRTGGGSGPEPVEPSEGDLKFADPADEAALQSIATTVGVSSSDRFELNLVSKDGKDLEDSTKWTVTAASNVVHVTTKNKLRFNKIGETTVTVTAKAADGSASYTMTFPVNVTKLGTPVLTVKKGSAKKTFTVKTEKVYGADKIIVRYSKTASVPNSSGKKTYTSKLASTKTIKVAKSNTRYYVKARAVASNGDKYDWSEIVSKKTK